MIPLNRKQFNLIKDKGVQFIDSYGTDCVIVDGIIFWKEWSKEDVETEESN